MLSCAKEEAIIVVADFDATVVNNDYTVPVYVAITNNTTGAEAYHWTFDGATPSSSSSRNPGNIIYNQPGVYTIHLDALNQDGSQDDKEITLEIHEPVIVTFDTEIIDNNYPPMEVAITNNTTGANSYHWTFDGGNPSTSTVTTPNNIIFNDAGDHLITLEVSNGMETYEETRTLTVAPHLVANFDYTVAFNDDDMQAPVTLTMQNNSISATNYNWTFTGAVPSTATDENPTITFNNPGTYTLSLEATNGKETQTFSQNITVLANTNLRTLTNIHLGINTAHNTNTVGAFYDIINRESYTENQVNASNGANIAIAFFGLNQNFGHNKFLSPDDVQNFTFAAIPNAVHTKFINTLENCNCNASLSLNEFDSMTDDSLLSALTITETTAGSQDFDNTTVPRIVLFETHDGRKGAIKIKNYIDDGQNSYIVVDIKVMKD